MKARSSHNDGYTPYRVLNKEYYFKELVTKYRNLCTNITKYSKKKNEKREIVSQIETYFTAVKGFLSKRLWDDGNFCDLFTTRIIAWVKPILLLFLHLK